MSVALDEIVRLIGGRTSGVQAKQGFEGFEFIPQDIQGGELFIDLSGDTAVVNEALSRGCSAVLTKEGVTANSDGAYIFTSDVVNALKEIAAWWRQRFSIPVAAVHGDGSSSVSSLLARLLLKKGRGAFIVTRDEERLDDFKALCKLHNACEWAVADLLRNDEEAWKMWQPQYEVCAHGEVKGTCQYLITPDEGRVCVAGEDKRDFMIRDVYCDPLGGCKFVLSGSGRELQLNSPLLGSWRVYEVALAVVTAMSLFPEISDEQIMTTVKRFNVMAGELTMRLTFRGRNIFDASALNDASGDNKVLSLAGEIKDKKTFVLCDRFDNRGRVDERNGIIQRLVELKPSEVILVAGCAELKEALKQADITVLEAPSAKAAVHIITKLNTEYIFITGGELLKDISNELIDIEGETVYDADLAKE